MVTNSRVKEIINYALYYRFREKYGDTPMKVTEEYAAKISDNKLYVFLKNKNDFTKSKPMLRIRLIYSADSQQYKEVDFSQSIVEYFVDSIDRKMYNDYKETPTQPSDRNALNSALELLNIPKEFRIKDGKLRLYDR